jgi:hypothetical protein
MIECIVNDCNENLKIIEVPEDLTEKNENF